MSKMYSFNSLSRMGAALILTGAICIGGTSSIDAKPTNELVKSIDITGTAVDTLSSATSAVTGTAQITSIDYDTVNDTLTFAGTITGVATADGVTTEIVSQVFNTSGTLVSEGAKKCSIIDLDLGEINLDLLGLTLDVSEIDLDVSGIRGPGKLLGNLLCKLTGLLDDNRIDKIDKQLTRINSIIGNALTNIDVGGIIDATDTFTGFATIDNIDIDDAGNLVFTGILSGVAIVNGETTSILNQVFSTTGTLTGSNSSGKGKKCDILFLDLGPLNLDVLGLQVDLSEVTIDLGATTGSGKLLGNLLCSLTRALDSDKANAVKKANKFIQKVNQSLLQI